MVPIEKDLIDLSILTKDERKWINNYHLKVFTKLKIAMNKNETRELSNACSAI